MIPKQDITAGAIAKALFHLMKAEADARNSRVLKIARRRSMLYILERERERVKIKKQQND